MQNTSFASDYPYLYRGFVVENKDPKKLGRCKIQIPSIHGGDAIPPNYLPWARGVSNIVIGETKGSSSIPDIGDIVWVLFEGGDDDYPVYLGGMQGTKDTPIKLEEVVLYQEKGNKIVYNRESHVFTIAIGDNIISVGDSIHISGGPINIDSSVSISGTVNISGSLFVNGELIVPCRCTD